MPAPKIDKVETRNKLVPRREPYWHRIETGCYLGFRKMTGESAGSWIARVRDAETGKQQYRALGDFDQFAAHERFDRAARAAREWFSHLAAGGSAAVHTVAQACAAYVRKLRDEGRDKAGADAAARFKRWVDEAAIGGIELQKLRPNDVAEWRRALSQTPATPQDKTKSPARSRSAATLNRDMTALRAALNLAKDNGHATSDTAWAVKLRPVRDAGRRRDVYLDRGQRRALIAASPADLAAFLRALSLVPLRPGAMASLVAGDFDRRLSTVAIGKDKHGRDRKITLPAATAAFFADHAKGKLPAAPLFARADGSPWNKDSWKGPLKAAVIAAGLPTAATAYSLRHAAITDLIALHRLDTLTVAQLSGTSLVMIERHYGHLLREHAAKALEGLTL